MVSSPAASREILAVCFLARSACVSASCSLSIRIAVVCFLVKPACVSSSSRVCVLFEPACVLLCLKDATLSRHGLFGMVRDSPVLSTTS